MWGRTEGEHEEKKKKKGHHQIPLGIRINSSLAFSSVKSEQKMKRDIFKTPNQAVSRLFQRLLFKKKCKLCLREITCIKIDKAGALHHIFYRTTRSPEGA